jgi:hypothetical protein
MRGLKGDLWKAGMVMAGLLFLLVIMAWIPVAAAGAEVRLPGVATPVTVQATPTVDATVTALSKEQLTLQVKQLQNQLQNQTNWVFSSSNALIAAVTAIIIPFFGIYQWAGNRRDARQKEIAAQDKELADRKDEREKRAEERFQAAVTGLGDEKEGARIGVAILLRTFLRPGYEEFYTQTFDLAVANLRLPRTPHPPEDPDAALPITTLSQALIVAIKEAFPLARSQSKGSPQSLDASRIQLDNAFLNGVDLKQVWMRQASLRKVKLRGANLSGASLMETNLSGAKLQGPISARLISSEPISVVLNFLVPLSVEPSSAKLISAEPISAGQPLMMLSSSKMPT